MPVQMVMLVVHNTTVTLNIGIGKTETPIYRFAQCLPILQIFDFRCSNQSFCSVYCSVYWCEIYVQAGVILAKNVCCWAPRHGGLVSSSHLGKLNSEFVNYLPLSRRLCNHWYWFLTSAKAEDMRSGQYVCHSFSHSVCMCVDVQCAAAVDSHKERKARESRQLSQNGEQLDLPQLSGEDMNCV